MSRRLQARKPPDAARFELECRFEAAARRLPAAHRPRLLSWLRRNRRRPERIFVEILPTGGWRLLE